MFEKLKKLSSIGFLLFKSKDSCLTLLTSTLKGNYMDQALISLFIRLLTNMDYSELVVENNAQVDLAPVNILWYYMVSTQSLSFSFVMSIFVSYTVVLHSSLHPWIVIFTCSVNTKLFVQSHVLVWHLARLPLDHKVKWWDNFPVNVWHQT